jgi:aspartyl-tRNA(Asn)/glutamyl-tRNA(Gln) amidotransferase subunit A
MAVASVGTDTGGSIRIPAAACGCVGLKPTFGELPVGGIVPLGRSLDHVGPIARTVGDARILYEALRGSRPQAAHPDISAADLRFGLPGPYFTDILDSEVRLRFDEALDRLRVAGAQIDGVRVPDASIAPAVYLAIQLPEASAYHAGTLERRPQDYQPGVRQRLELGRYVLAEDYVRAQRGREALRCQVDAALGGRQALVLPTLPIPAPRFGDEGVSIGGRSEPVRGMMLRMTQLFNLTGHPAISIPCGTTSAGLPCGLQLVGRIGRTGDLLGWRACQKVLGLALIARLFHRWERHLASADTDRVVRPFGWASTGAPGPDGAARIRKTCWLPSPPRPSPIPIGSSMRRRRPTTSGSTLTASSREPAGLSRFPVPSRRRTPRTTVSTCDTSPAGRTADHRGRGARSWCFPSGTRMRAGMSACAGCWRTSA